MKKLFTLAFLTVIVLGLQAQKQEKEAAHELSKDARKGQLAEFKYDEEEKTYTLIYAREKSRKILVNLYKFDYDFNQIAHEEEEIELEKAKEKYDFIEYDGDEGEPLKLLRVEENLTGQIVLRTGYMTKKWATSPEGIGYYKYNFVEEEKVKPKIEIPIEFPENTPGFVKKIAEGQAKKILLKAYMTDEPQFSVTTGARSFRYKSVWEAKRNYQEATGDIVILGYQEWYIKKDLFNRFLVLKYKAENLEREKMEVVDFEFPTDVVYKQKLADGTMAVVLAPTGTYKPKDPNPCNYTFLKISRNAEVLEKIAFESPSSYWNIANMVLSAKGDLYIYGSAYKEKNDKHFDKLKDKNSFDNFQIMKISDGKVAFLTSTGLDEFENKMQIPPSQKKGDTYEGADFIFTNFSVLDNGDILIEGQSNDHVSVNIFHLDKEGKLRAQYAADLEETGSDAKENMTDHACFPNVDGKTITWFIGELEGIQKEVRPLKYPRLATINIAEARLMDFQTFGHGDEDYYIDNDYPLIFTEGGKKIVFFGADKKEKNIWFSRVELGVQ